MFRVLATLLAAATIAHGVDWNGNRASACDFIGNDLTNTLSTREDCAYRCASTTGCTHYTWTNYENGTCWMKKNPVSKNDAIPKYDQDALCGIIDGSVGRSISGVASGAVDGLGANAVGTVVVDSAIGVGGSVSGVADGLGTNAVGVVVDSVGSVGGALTANVSGVLASAINWNGNNWASSCQFIGNDLTNALTTAVDCLGRCAITPHCTHYTWTNYNGGTCWMKSNSVSISDAVPKQDQGALCGVVVTTEGGVLAANVSGVLASGINWNGNNWAVSCHFIGNDLANALTTAPDCGGRCAGTPGCTHYTWTNYKGGTCWMKKNSVSKSDAVLRFDQGALCGVVIGNVAIGVGGLGTLAINWNGNNWASSCQFIGNDLANVLTNSKDCGGRCAATPGCTHYTWTNYNGGTCWMKKNSVSKGDAVPKHDQGAVCGITIGNGGLSIGNAVEGGLGAIGINWNGNNWAASCHFIGNDLANVLTRAEDCGGRCAATPGCTHYTWTNYNRGTCWMKKNLVSQSDAVPRFDHGAVCGVVVGSAAIGVGGLGTLGINWNGNSWASSCQFIGNDLANALTSSKDCGGRCAATPGCTHYTWTNYNGGTCWMKKNSVSKGDAVPKHDQGAVCGVTIGNGGLTIGNGGITIGSPGVGGIGAIGVNWNGNNWASSCQFIGNDLANALTSSKDCGGRCAATPDCTHYTWTNYNGGTCWMKKNSVSKGDAVPKHDQGAVCGVTIGNAASVGGVGASAINWSGNNWVSSCDLLGNDVTKILTRAEDCGWQCVSIPGCTNYSWSNSNGGTCWIKRSSDVKVNVVTKHDHHGIDYFNRPIPYYKQITINVV